MRRATRSRSGSREFDEALGSIENFLREAVVDTIATGSPQPARDRVAELLDVDDEFEYLGYDPLPSQTLALVVLSSWLLRPAREGELADPERVLDWIGSHLGARYRARARYVIGMLDAGTAREAVSLYAQALDDDFLPTLIWIAAALTVLHGAGDLEWLAEVPVPGT